MTKKVCAFCKNDKKFTREHLWPTSLHKRIRKVNKQSKTTVWLSKINRDIPTEIVIKDVCQDCNNGELSRLDAYICKLFDEYFYYMPSMFEDVSFDFDYHLLKRWLLKMCFNTSRANDSFDRAALESLAPYILGENEGLGRSVQLFLALTYPQEYPEDNERFEGFEYSFDCDDTYLVYPCMNRSGFTQYSVPNIGKKILRSIHLRSYSFFLAYWEPGKGMSEQYDFASFFSSPKLVVQLRPNMNSVRLNCSGIGAWDSLKDSRNYHFSI